jgi:hypothetical protein
MNRQKYEPGFTDRRLNFDGKINLCVELGWLIPRLFLFSSHFNFDSILTDKQKIVSNLPYRLIHSLEGIMKRRHVAGETSYKKHFHFLFPQKSLFTTC